MNKIRVRRTLMLGVLLALFTAIQVRTQDVDGVLAEEQELARQLLASPWADYLSGSGLNAAIRMSGASSAHANLQALQRGNASVVLPFQSHRFQVMVNDPAQDLFELSDVSTQSETAVAGFGNVVVVTFNDSGQILSVPAASFMGYSRSNDGGETFTDLGMVPPFVSSPAQFNNGDPALVADRAGNFYTAHLGSVATPTVRPTGFGNAIGIHKSTDGGQTWGPAVYPTTPGVKVGSTQDKEFLAVDTSGGAFNGNVYVSWTSFGGTTPPGGSPNPPIFFSRSTDGGGTFSVPIQISPFAHSNQGSEPAVGPNGEVYVAWFRISGPSPGPGLPPLGRAIMVAKSTNGGATFGLPVEVTPVVTIGFGNTSVNARLRGNFRTNSFPRIDVNPLNGEVYIVYNANPAGPDGADIFFTRSTNGGTTWSTPIRVNDDHSGNDQYFPDIAVNAQGVIEVIWYDQRLDPQNLRIDVYKARSYNGGASFGPNQRLTQGSAVPAVGFDPFINPNYMGDYIDIKAIMTPSGPGSDFLLSWGDFRRVITTNGGTRPDQDVVFAIDH
jgi:hypothetical protein